MSLEEFQRAIVDLVASPELCLSFRAEPGKFLERYELTDVERRRLSAVNRQRGMSTNCSLYRSNRITPIYTLLPLTCFVLGDVLGTEMEGYWRSEEFVDRQFLLEIERFGEHIRRRMRSGVLSIPVLGEVLNFELAWNALNVGPRNRVPAESRLLTFTHEPRELFRRLEARDPLPYRLPRGEFFVLLRALDGSIETTVLDADAARDLL